MGLIVKGPTIDKLVEEVLQVDEQGTTDLEALKTEFSSI